MFGHKLRPSGEMVRLYSPRGSSLLALQAVRQPCEETDAAAAAITADEGAGVASDVLFVAKRLAEPWTDYVQGHVKKGWRLSLFGRDPEREVTEGNEGETAEARLKEMERILNVSVVDPAR